MGTHYGNSNQGFQARDVFNSSVTIHQSGNDASTGDPRKDLLNSLWFANMSSRAIAKQHTQRTKGTGRWVLKHEKYESWLVDGGVLWIRGRAGCGKTMLMDFVLSEELRNCQGSDVVVLSFFFHHGSGGLHQSSRGLYRALLHQVLSLDEELPSRFASKTNCQQRSNNGGPLGEGSSWHEEELRCLCEEAVKHLAEKRQDLRIYVDAIDENCEGDAKGLINWPFMFEDVYNDFVISIESENRQDVEAFLDERLETLTGHTSTEDLLLIKRKLAGRTYGIFLWLVNSIDDVQENLKSGWPPADVLDYVEVLPNTLKDIYVEAFRKIPDHKLEFAIRAFQWIALARRPLPVNDLRCAVCLPSYDAPGTTATGWRSKAWCLDSAMFSNMVERLCRNFIVPIPLAHFGVKVPAGVPQVCKDETDMFAYDLDTNDNTTEELYQGHRMSYGFVFNHESVSEFVLEHGLQLLENRRQGGRPLVSTADRHLSMAEDCFRHLQTEDVVRFARSRTFSRESVASKILRSEGYRQGAKWSKINSNRPSWTFQGIHVRHFLREYENHVLDGENLPEEPPDDLPISAAPPLVLYAGRYLQGHIIAAELNNAPSEQMVEFLIKRPEESWSHLYKMQLICMDRAFVEGFDSFRAMHFLSMLGLCRTMEALLQAHPNDIAGGPPASRVRKAFIEESDSTSQTPIFVAATWGRRAVVDLLLRYGANQDIQTQPLLQTTLHLAAQYGHKGIVETLLAHGMGNIDAKDCAGDTALSCAVIEGRIETVRLLIKHTKLGVHSQELVTDTTFDGESIRFGTPLFNAWHRGSVDMVKLLLTSEGIDARMQDAEGRSILHFACYQRNDQGQSSQTCEKTRLLVESGRIDLNVKDERGNTPFLAALHAGKVEILNMLLNVGGVDFDGVTSEVQMLSPLPQIGPFSASEIEKGLADFVHADFGSGTVITHARDARGARPNSNAAQSGEEENRTDEKPTCD